MSEDNNKPTQNNKPQVALSVVPKEYDQSQPMVYDKIDISDAVTQYYPDKSAFELYTKLLKMVNVSADGFEDFLYLISPVKIKTAHRQLDELIDMVIVNSAQNNAMKKRVKEIINHIMY